MDRRRFLKGNSAALLSLSGMLAYSEKLKSVGLDWSDLLEKTTYSKSKPLRILYPKGCLANLKPIIQVFEALTGAKVEVQETGFDSISNVMLKSHLLGNANTLFDLAIPATFSIPDLAEAGVIRSLDEMKERFGVSQNIQSLYRHGDAYQGKLYGLQSSGDAYLLFLRKSWLLDPENQKRYQDRYGYALDIPLSWEELDRQMSFFHVPEKGKYGGCMFRSKLYMHWEFWIRLHAQGTYPFGRSMQPLVDSSEAIQALAQMKQATEYLHPDSAKNGPYENFSVFIEGNCYANMSWGGGQKFFNAADSKIKDDLIITQTPGVKIDNGGLPISYFNWGWSYVMAANTDKAELAFLFMLIATSAQHSSAGIAEAEGFFDPFLEEHFSNQNIEQVYGRPFLDSLQVGLANAIPDLYMAGQTNYFAALRTGLHASLFQNVPIEISLKAVADKWAGVTESLGTDKQVEQWHRLQNNYPDVLKSMLKGF